MNKKDILAFLFFFGLSLLIVFPALFHLPSQMIGDTGDGYQFLGFQYLAKREFFAGNFPFGWIDYWRYPFGVELSNIIDSSLLIVLGLFFYQLTSNPIFVYNLSVISIIFLNLVVSYIAFRMIFDRMPAMFGAIIYGLSFYSIGKLGGHMNLYSLAGFPLIFSSLILLYQTNGKLKYMVLSTLALIFIAFSSLQFPLFFIGSLPFLLPLTYLFFPEQSKKFLSILWQKKITVVFCLIGLISVFSLFHGAKLHALVTGEVPMPVDHISSVPIINFIIPNVYLRAFIAEFPNTSKEWIEYTLPFGYAELILFILAIIFVHKSKFKFYLISAFSIFFILALGTQDFLKPIWPYQYLFPIFPYRGIIEPGRFFIIFYFFSTVLILLFLRQIKDKVILLLLMSVLIIQRLPTDLHISPSFYDETFIAKVQEPPSNAILDLPVYVDWWNGQIYDLYSTYYEKPIVNGYVQWSGNIEESQTMVKQLEPFSCYPPEQEKKEPMTYEASVELREKTIRLLKFYNIRTIVVHKDLNLNDPQCERARKNIEILVEEKNRWVEVYNTSDKRILWLKD